MTSRPSPEEIKRALCDLTIVEPTPLGFDAALAQVYSNGETVVVTAQVEGAGFYVHDNGTGAMVLESSGVNATSRLHEELRKGVSAYGCNLAQFRVFKQCRMEDLSNTIAIVGCASRFVADFSFHTEAPPMFDFRRQVVEVLLDTLGADRIRENDEVRAQSGSRYQVSATVLDERASKPLAYVEAVSNHQAVARKFRALYDMMNTPLIAETRRFSIFDDTSSTITSADLALLKDVSQIVPFRQRNTLSQIADSIQ